MNKIALLFLCCLLCGCSFLVFTKNKEATTKIRLMQYNIGAFNFGSKVSPGLSDKNYTEKLTAYKKMFRKYRPDVVGLQECIEYIDSKHEHLTNDVLFDDIYPHKYDYYKYERAIKAKYPVIFVRNIWLKHIFEPNNPNAKKYWAGCVHCKVIVNKKIIDVITTAFPSRPGVEYRKARAILLPQVLALLDKAEYGFVILDMNNGGNGSDVSATQEGEELLKIARDAGWDFANGGFLPFQKTYFDPVHRPYLFSPIDQIIYKNNGKINIKDFRVLYDEYKELTSDHAPVYADFSLN